MDRTADRHRRRKGSGCGILGSEISDGDQLPLRDVMHLMIVLSDNTATNMILERFTADAVNAYLDSSGSGPRARCARFWGRRPLKGPGWSAAGKLPENQKYGIGVSTPRDMVTIWRNWNAARSSAPIASREMIDVLKRCQDNTGIRRKLRGVTSPTRPARWTHCGPTSASCIRGRAHRHGDHGGRHPEARLGARQSRAAS